MGKARQGVAQGREPQDAVQVIDRAAPKRAARDDVFVYFDNDAKVRAPRDASRLMTRLEQPAVEPGAGID